MPRPYPTPYYHELVYFEMSFQVTGTLVYSFSTGRGDIHILQHIYGSLQDVGEEKVLFIGENMNRSTLMLG